MYSCMSLFQTMHIYTLGCVTCIAKHSLSWLSYSCSSHRTLKGLVTGRSHVVGTVLENKRHACSLVRCGKTIHPLFRILNIIWWMVIAIIFWIFSFVEQSYSVVLLSILPISENFCLIYMSFKSGMLSTSGIKQDSHFWPLLHDKWSRRLPLHLKSTPKFFLLYCCLGNTCDISLLTWGFYLKQYVWPLTVINSYS